MVDGFIDKHPHLYHYTTEAGLAGILDANSFWATYFADLNDSTEIFHLKDPLKRELSNRLAVSMRAYRSSSVEARRIVVRNGGAERMARKLATSWVDALYSTTFEQDDDKRQGFCGIVSFCSHADDQDYERENGLLSQWRGYGRDGGYCLVFDTAAMQALINRERSSNFYLHVELSAVKYLFRKELVAEYFQELIDRSIDIAKASLNDDPNVKSLASQVFVPFVNSATTTKHRGFYEEREIRLVAMAATEAADARIRDKEGYRPEPIKAHFELNRGGRLRHYNELFGLNFERLPLIKILVGPSRKQADNIKFAQSLVSNRVPVFASETPYID